MDDAKEKKINGLVEDQETYRFLLEDLLEQNPNDTDGIADLQATVNRIEDEIAELLGTKPSGAPEAPSSSNQNGVPPQSPPAPYPTTQTSTLSSSPADPASAPYHPSTAPSPFAAGPGQPSQSFMSILANDSRKRQRQDSMGSPVHQSSKRTTVNRHKSRYEELQAEMERELKSSRELHDESKDPQSVQIRATAEGISIEEVLEKLEKEQQDDEDAIRAEYQVEMDEQMARMVQAEDAVSDSEDDRRSGPPAMFIDLPDRTLPHPSTDSWATPHLIDPPPPRRYAVPTQFDYNPAPPGSYPYQDDDLQEIPREYFTSRLPGSPAFRPPSHPSTFSRPSALGYPPTLGNFSAYGHASGFGPASGAAQPPALGPPQYTPMFGGPNPLIRGRSLPWMHDPNPAPEMIAIDLLRDNPLGLDDADDLEYVDLLLFF